jgi:hypothetical protein
MQAINRAWAILSDPARRAAHEASADARPSSTAHWSARTGRTYWAPPPASWSTGTAAVPPYRSPVSSVEDGQSWLGVLARILLLAVIAPLLFMILPLQFSGLFVLLVLSALTRGVGR